LLRTTKSYAATTVAGIRNATSNPGKPGTATARHYPATTTQYAAAATAWHDSAFVAGKATTTTHAKFTDLDQPTANAMKWQFNYLNPVFF
jgi:hypothetical protein